MIQTIFKKTKEASYSLASVSNEKKREVLYKIADAIGEHEEELLAANANDLSRMDPKNPLYDRLQLTHDRLEGIASDMRHVADLESPLGEVIDDYTLENGLRLRRVTVPFGVIGIIYEARPNVSFDVFSICFKSGNACVLKGGKDADESNRAIVSMMRKIIEAEGIDPNILNLLPATHEATGEMLQAVGYIDLCIPRGGKRLIEFVRDNARVPVIETGAGVVHTYFDEYGDVQKGRAIINNGKTRRVSVCNALDCLIVHSARLNDLPAIVEPMVGKVAFHCDERSAAVLGIEANATEEDYGREWMSYDLSIKTVDSIEECLNHIRKHGSGHSEAIVTESAENAELFQQQADAACVYVNAPTAFTDGAQFGLGAEIGISTQKLGPRGPMALKAMTTYKWLINGNGQTRK